MIYFVQGAAGGPVKIGATRALTSRLAEHERTYETKLVVLGVTDGWLVEEKAFHRRFRHLKEWGEWFSADAELLDFIRDETRRWDGLDEQQRSPRREREIVHQYKADPSVSAEFKAWLDGLAADVGAPVTITIDMALKEFAERRRYKPMPRRLVR